MQHSQAPRSTPDAIAPPARVSIHNRTAEPLVLDRQRLRDRMRVLADRLIQGRA